MQPDDRTDQDGREQFAVVVNDEEQHSIWPVGRPVPGGWREVGFRGTKEACLNHIAQVWTDITPRSVREARRGG